MDPEWIKNRILKFNPLGRTDDQNIFFESNDRQKPTINDSVQWLINCVKKKFSSCCNQHAAELWQLESGSRKRDPIDGLLAGYASLLFGFSYGISWN